MSDSHVDESPAGLAAAFTGTMRDIAQDEDRDHEARYHVPPRRMDPPKALPFASQELDDVTLAQMVEMLEGQKLPEDVVFTVFDVPRTLALRCLADYKARVTRHILSRAIA